MVCLARALSPHVIPASYASDKMPDTVGWLLLESEEARYLTNHQLQTAVDEESVGYYNVRVIKRFSLSFYPSMC